MYDFHFYSPKAIGYFQFLPETENRIMNLVHPVDPVRKMPYTFNLKPLAV
jgi:hypothetical protein